MISLDGLADILSRYCPILLVQSPDGALAAHTERSGVWYYVNGYPVYLRVEGFNLIVFYSFIGWGYGQSDAAGDLPEQMTVADYTRSVFSFTARQGSAPASSGLIFVSGDTGGGRKVPVPLVLLECVNRHFRNTLVGENYDASITYCGDWDDCNSGGCIRI